MAHQAATPNRAAPLAAEPFGPSPNGADGRHRPRLRRPPRRILFPIALVVFGLVAVAVWLTLSRPTPGPLTASGTVEFDEVTLAAQAAGRIADLSAEEGSYVTEGDVIGHVVDPVVNVQNKQSISDPAQQQLSQAQLARMELTAPLTGVVQKQLAHRGEFVAPGAPVLTVADPTNLKLTLFVLEGDLGRVSVGQSVSLRADAFPGRVFPGRVTAIADRAQFTPRNVQTPRDRQNLVFAVTVRMQNADRALKAGLPVDATFD